MMSAEERPLLIIGKGWPRVGGHPTMKALWRRYEADVVVY